MVDLINEMKAHLKLRSQILEEDLVEKDLTTDGMIVHWMKRQASTLVSWMTFCENYQVNLSNFLANLNRLLEIWWN